MRAIRELALAAPLALVGAALFFGGGPANGSVFWLGTLGLAALLLLFATHGAPGGALSVLPLAALAGLMGVSIAWSTLGDRSWDYADRAFVYALFAALGLWLSARTRELALGLLVLLGAVVVWSLAGKVLPFLYDYGPPDVTRLRSPVGLWNQLALLGAFALPLALWRRGLQGTLLAYGWIVALLLTYSRGGILTALVVVAAWLVLTDERVDSAATLVAAALPAGVVVAIAFALPGVTSDHQSLHVRWRDGIVFGVLLAAGAFAARTLERRPRPRMTPARTRAVLAALALVAVAGVVFVFLKGSGSGAVGNSGGRLGSTSSNFRFVWWQQAWDGFRHHVLGGTGAGSFHLTNLRYRQSYLDFTTEPHNLPLQMLTELGLAGLAVFCVAVAALLRGSLRRRGHELALALVFPAFLVHALVDVDWDFVAVSLPAFLVAGALVGRPATRLAPAFASLALAGAALIAFGALLLPWLGERWASQADATLSSVQQAKLAKRARSVDPLLLDPLITLAFAYELHPDTAIGYYDEAIRRQPQNPEPYLLAGRYALRKGCPRRAYTYLERFTELNPKDKPENGGDDYRHALALVNSGKPTC